MPPSLLRFVSSIVHIPFQRMLEKESAEQMAMI